MSQNMGTKLSVSILLGIVCCLSRVHASYGNGDVTADVFGDGDAAKNVFPVAFTDYDGDKRMDLIVLTKNFSSFRIYFGSEDTPSLQYQPGFQCDIVFTKDSTLHPVKINGLNVADFTGDGVNDILVTFTYFNQGEPQTLPKTMFASVFEGGRNKFSCQPLVLNRTDSTSNKTRLQLSNEPLIVDVNGDMIADLVGETSDNKRYIWIFRDDHAPPHQLAFTCIEMDGCLTIVTGGFVDIDGDLSPDLVLITVDRNTTTSFPNHIVEIYNTDNGNFKLRQTILIDIPTGQVGNALFLDVNMTGEDHAVLLPFCPDKKCKTSGFILIDVKSERVHVLNVSFTDSYGIEWAFIPFSVHQHYLQTINVRSGDYDLDGYPDLVATLAMTKRSSSETETRSVLFRNIPCRDYRGSCKYSRTFEPNFDLLDTYSNVISAAFYDSNANGLLDIMGIRRTSASVGPNETFAIFIKENSPEYDAYFIRWIITTGVCKKSCPPYGVMLPGGTMKYSTTNLNSQTQGGRASQVFRTNFALDLPGNLMGTGASANFIDRITFGGVSNQTSYTRTRVIPNSNLIVIPWKAGSKYMWEMKQLLRPKGGGIMATFHVLVFICILNASLVFFLHMKERKIDRIEKHTDPVSMSALTMT